MSLLLWAPVVLYMALIFGASSLSDPRPLPSGVSDKTAHLAAYALLSALIIRALARGRLDGITWRRVLMAVVFSTIYGMSDEFHQLFVPTRSADVLDIAADAIGACAGVAIAGVFKVIRGVHRGQSRPT